MRQVTKRAEPAEITQWKALENSEWRPSYEVLQNPEKQSLHSALVDEQYFTCCYCGRRIEIETSHIEHFKPRTPFPEIELEYSNLFASCIRERPRSGGLHCGHAKGSWFEAEFAITPLEDGCETRFNYTRTGAIQPASSTDPSAAKMIQVLELNTASLKNRREAVLAGVFDDRFIESSTPEELELLVAQFGEPKNGRLSDFAHVIVRFAIWLQGANA